MRRVLLASCLFAAVSLMRAAPAMAQIQPWGDVAVSYSVLYDSDLSSDIPGMSGLLPTGWLVSASGRVKGPFSVVGEIGANYRPQTIQGVDVTVSIYGYLGGVRYRRQLESKVTPFVQLLAGLARAQLSATGLGAASDEAFVGQVGGGVDIEVTKRTAVRLQGDYRGLRAHGFSWSEFRLATGIAYKF